ncbi:hypothetical protein V1520DRAFT_339393 [Lipomyces starkeyi]|uniref:SET domain-containing protein n=1 Tax=Lipomyces starkeyi NRRL Y-11557 TaxID=675824 RepID=A0A1E3PZ16_LIPST|nr:hypothetical protein LIPSTDRAFT_107301 [Lipomyces starkeyi NRRL Y-11557]
MTQLQAPNGAAFLSTHLSTFDDYLTVILIDALYFWIPVHKVHPGSRPPRGPSPATITSLLRAHACDSSPTALLSAFLGLPSIKSFLAGLSHTPRLRHEFEAHARRYLAMYAPTVPFELGTTERYRAVSRRSETCILARRPIPAGTTIQHLSGKMVALSSQDETGLKRDFSIIYSHRLGESCLMLGPCRFVNHDCDPNARFIAQGGHGVVAVVAIRKIEVREEITVSYADNYFGKKNRECMCATCERRGKGFFGPSRRAQSSKTMWELRSASESGATSESGSETELDSDFRDSICSEDENGIRRHGTRSRKRQRREMLELRDTPTSMSPYPTPTSASPHPSLSRSLLSLSPQKEPIKIEDDIRNFGHTFEDGCRRSQRILTARAPVKSVTVPNDRRKLTPVSTEPAKKPDIGEPVRRSPRKNVQIAIAQNAAGSVNQIVRRGQQPVCMIAQKSQTRTQRRKQDLADRRRGLSTPPLSVSESNDDPSDTEWDSDADAELYDTWTNRIQASPDLIYNAFWGTLERDNVSANGKFPRNQQDLSALEDNRDIIVPPFQTRKCANKNCQARFLLARGGRGRSLETACAEYVRRYDLKLAVQVVCVKCNRHAGIYGFQWPEVETLGAKVADESAEDYNHEEHVPVEFVNLW